MYYFALQTLSARFYPYDEIHTDAVLGLDDDALLTTDEVNNEIFFV